MLNEKILINKEEDKYLNLSFSSVIDTNQLNEIQNLIDREKNLFINLTPDEEVLKYDNTDIFSNLNILFYNNTVSGYTNNFLISRLGFTNIDILTDSQGIRKSFFYFPLYDINNINKESLVGFGFLKLTKDNIINTTNGAIQLNNSNFSFYIKKKGLALDQTVYYYKLQFFNARTGERHDFSTNETGIVSGNTEYYSITLNKNNYTFSFNNQLKFYEIYTDFITQDSLNNRNDLDYTIDEVTDNYVKTIEGKLSGDTIEILEDRFLDEFNRESRSASLRLVFPQSGGTFSMVAIGDKVKGISDINNDLQNNTIVYNYNYFDITNGVTVNATDSTIFSEFIPSFVKFSGSIGGIFFTFPALLSNITINSLDPTQDYVVITAQIVEENNDVLRQIDISDNDILAYEAIELYPKIYFNGNQNLKYIRAENNIFLNEIKLATTFYNFLDFTNCRLNYFDITTYENTFNSPYGGYYSFLNNNFTTEDLDLFLEKLDTIVATGITVDISGITVSAKYVNRFFNLKSINYSGTTTPITGTTYINNLINNKDCTIITNENTYSSSIEHIKFFKATERIITKEYQVKDNATTLSVGFEATNGGIFKFEENGITTSYGTGNFSFSNVLSFSESTSYLTYLQPIKIYFETIGGTSNMNSITKLNIVQQNLTSFLDLYGLVNLNELNIQNNKINSLILPTGTTMSEILAQNNNINYVNFEHTNVFNVTNASFSFSNNFLKSEEVNNMLISLSKGTNSGFSNRTFYIGGNNEQPTVYDSTVSGYTEALASNVSNILPIKPSATISDENWFWNPNTFLHEPITGGAAIRDLLEKSVFIQTNLINFS